MEKKMTALEVVQSLIKSNKEKKKVTITVRTRINETVEVPLFEPIRWNQCTDAGQKVIVEWWVCTGYIKKTTDTIDQTGNTAKIIERYVFRNIENVKIEEEIK